MQVFLFNLKHSFQNLKKNVAYSVLTIAGLTIGLTVFIVTALYVFNEKTVDYNIANHNRIYRLFDAKNNNCGIGYEMEDIIKNYIDVEANCAFLRFDWPMIFHSDKQNVKFSSGISTTNRFFEVFNIPVTGKTGEQPFSEKASIVLTQATATKLFGNKNPLGKMVNIDKMFDVKVTAIISGFPENSSISADYLLNAADKEMRMSSICNNSDCYNPMSHFLLLKNGVDNISFVSQFNKTIGQYQTRVDSFGIQKLTDIYLSEYKDENGNRLGNISFLRVISLIGFIILTLAIINYLNFSMSLQHSKLREISIKKINGAGTLQLFFYYLAETLIVVVIAIVLSILFINIFKNTFSGIFSTALNLAILKTPLFILIILLVLLIILLVNSIIPAYSLLKLNVVDGINNSIKRKNKSSIKTIFTTGQFVVSIALLMAVFFIHKQLSFIESKDLGFNRQNLLRMGIPWGFKENVALKNGIDNLNFVTSSSYSNGCPGDINLVLGSGGEENEVDFQTILIDKDFFKTFEIEVVDGRGFMGGDFKKACMFNRTGLKKIGWNDIKNRRFNNGSKDGYEVIGVVNDFNVSSLHSFQKPVCLLFDNSNAYNNLSIRIVPGEINRQIEQLKKVWESVTEAPFEVQFYDTFFNAQYKKERQLSKSISILAVVAILLTLLGILGQVIQTCVFRTKEIGIRKVNGASVLEIMSMLNLDFLKWVVVAFVIATPLAYLAITRWLENFAYKTELSWWVFVFAGVFILLISVVTVSIQTFRVARRNPIESLRYE